MPGIQANALPGVRLIRVAAFDVLMPHLTFDQTVANGFLMREELRHDFSNQPYFLTDTLGNLSNSQTTATVGLVWWFGGKQGAW